MKAGVTPLSLAAPRSAPAWRETALRIQRTRNMSSGRGSPGFREFSVPGEFSRSARSARPGPEVKHANTRHMQGLFGQVALTLFGPSCADSGSKAANLIPCSLRFFGPFQGRSRPSQLGQVCLLLTPNRLHFKFHLRAVFLLSTIEVFII